MSEEELSEEEKQLKRERAKSWLIGQQLAKKNFIPEAHEAYVRQKENEERAEEETDEREENVEKEEQ